MVNESKFKNENLSLDLLKGMQSVRATFTLPRHTINLLSMAANQLGVRHKSIFDQLVKNKQILDQLAGEARNHLPPLKKRKQKTFVLSRNSLNTLDTFAKKYRLPRDVLVEFSVKQLHPVMAREKQKHESRKTLLKEMENFRESGCRFMEKAKHLVGEEDSIFQKLEYVFNLYDKNMDDPKNTIEKGRCLKEFQ